MNATSSRSHSIFTIYIESSEKIEKGQRIKAGKLNLVDLAVSLFSFCHQSYSLSFFAFRAPSDLPKLELRAILSKKESKSICL